MKRTLIAFAAAVAAAVAGPALAHHAFNMFALDKLVTVSGTVTKYDFRMPHVWIYMDMKNPETGVVEPWGFECHAPNLVARKGWKPSTLKAGDKVTLIMHPMKDGTHAGSVVNVVVPDGRTLWNAESTTTP